MEFRLPRLSASHNPWAPGSFTHSVMEPINTLSDSELMPPPAPLTAVQMEARRHRQELAAAKTLRALSLGPATKLPPSRQDLTANTPLVRRTSHPPQLASPPKVVRVRPSSPLPTTAETAPPFDPTANIKIQDTSDESGGYKPVERAAGKTYRKLVACPYRREDKLLVATAQVRPQAKRQKNPPLPPS